MNIHTSLLSKILLVIICISTFVSCRKIVQIEFSEFEQKITVNTIITPNSLMELHLSYTNGLTNNPLDVIENANINLFVNNKFSQQLNYRSSGIFVSDTVMESLNNYRCELYWDADTITASCTMPDTTSLKNVSLNPYAWISIDGIACPAVSFKIKNNSSVMAYYEACIYVFERSSLSDENNFYYSDSFILQQFTNQNESEPKINKTIEFEVRTIASDTEYAYILELRTISPDYYQYMQSLILYEQGRFPSFDIGSTLTYNLYTNVQNGYGIFAAYASTFSDTLYSN